MKKTLQWLVIVSMVGLLGGIGLVVLKQPTPEKKEQIDIGVVLYNAQDPFIKKTVEYLETYIREIHAETDLAFNLTYKDSTHDQSLQNEQISKLIEEGYDLLIVNTVEREDASLIIDKAQNVNVPVIFFNREPVPQDIARWDKLAYVGSKAEEAGKLQGELLADALDAGLEVDLNQDGKIQYVMLEGEYGHQDAILRTYHCIRTLEQRGYRMENLATDTAMWQRDTAKAKMEEWYTNLGDQIEVVMANNDEMALGAIECLKEKGYFEGDKTIPVLGVDGLDEAVKAMEEGTLLGTVLNDSKEQAKCMLYKIFELLELPMDETLMPITEKENQYFWVKHVPLKKHTLEDKK
ncbi:galactose ABC transporter substrate-binding protein [Niameybacter massiliensis]|uniref:galactose ABC transporter substrate-binding protein n=1 Tax=Niameybacter massiliensis TaxID=1658108 RepID=UPI0006B45F41|nr:galactose ABC transporter substrate-binding protein [Niameybacter massiliensis]